MSARSVLTAVVAGSVLALSLTGCGGSTHAATPKPRHSTAASVPESPAAKCANTVMGYLNQTPQALREGYTSGINMDPIRVDFGVNSPTYMAAMTGQIQLISAINQQGQPDQQLVRIVPAVVSACERDGQVAYQGIQSDTSKDPAAEPTPDDTYSESDGIDPDAPSVGAADPSSGSTDWGADGCDNPGC